MGQIDSRLDTVYQVFIIFKNWVGMVIFGTEILNTITLYFLICKVNCEWGSYGEWSSCSKSCYQSRTRLIATPASNGGQACEGNASERRNCSTDACRKLKNELT